MGQRGVRVDQHALGPQRQGRAAADAVDVDRERPHLPALDRDHAGRPIDRAHGAEEAVVLAHELGDEGALGPLIEVLRRRHLLDHPMVQHRDAVRHGQRFGLVVGDVDHGDAQALVEVLDLVLHLLAQLLVERAERLVHQDQLGLEHARARPRPAAAGRPSWARRRCPKPASWTMSSAF